MSNKPIITPTADVLRDEKAILVFVGLIVETLVNTVPALAPYSTLLSLVAFLGFGLLVLHQSIEDLIYAWADAKTTTTVISKSLTDESGTSVSTSVETKQAPAVTVKTEQLPIPLSATMPVREPLPDDAGSKG